MFLLGQFDMNLFVIFVQVPETAKHVHIRADKGLCFYRINYLAPALQGRLQK